MGFETILSAIGLGTQVFGAFESADAAEKQSQAEQDAYLYQAAVARKNAAAAGRQAADVERFGEYQAKDTEYRGARAEQNLRLQTAGLKGTQRAAFAARGIDMGEGTALAILTDTDFMGEQDVATARLNTSKEAWATRTQSKNTARAIRDRGENYVDDAGLLATRASQEDPSGAYAGTLLSGAGQVASSWYRYKKAGEL